MRGGALYRSRLEGGLLDVEQMRERIGRLSRLGQRRAEGERCEHLPPVLLRLLRCRRCVVSSGVTRHVRLTLRRVCDQTRTRVCQPVRHIDVRARGQMARMGATQVGDELVFSHLVAESDVVKHTDHSLQ